MLRSIQKAIKEALLALPVEEYDWFDVHGGPGKKAKAPAEKPVIEDEGGELVLKESPDESSQGESEAGQKRFFEFPGPLFSVRISPASSVVPVAGSKNLRAVARDRSNRTVEENPHFQWEVIDGEGTLENAEGEIATFKAPETPGLSKVRLTVKQSNITCAAEGLVTVTQSLLP